MHVSNVHILQLHENEFTRHLTAKCCITSNVTTSIKIHLIFLASSQCLEPMLNSKSKEMLKLCSKIARRLNSTSTPSLLRCRHLSQTNGLFDTNSSRNNEKSNTLPATKWDKIYNMDEINFLGIVSKLKLYQGIASVITIPSSYIGEILAIVPHGTTQAVFAMCT